MIDTDALFRKNKSLKQAIERYNMYRKYIDLYKATKLLDDYAEYIISTTKSMNKDLAQYYEAMIHSYRNGNSEPLLSNLYDRLLSADEYRNKVSEELKTLLKES